MAITGIVEEPLVTKDVSEAISGKAFTLKRSMVTTYLKAFGLPVLNSLSEDRRMKAATAFGGGADRSSGARVELGSWRTKTRDALSSAFAGSRIKTVSESKTGAGADPTGSRQNFCSRISLLRVHC